MNLPPRLASAIASALSAPARVGGRGRVALCAALIALVARCGEPSPPAKTVEGIAAMLGREAGGSVAPDQFIWEPRGGAISDAIVGRRVLFIAKLPGPQGGSSEPAGDLFRARVRLSRAGRAIGVSGLWNLTSTPLGDDRDLVARGRYAAFSTAAFGAAQGVTVLDLEGDEGNREAKTRRERAQAAIESYLETGSWRGVGRTEISFARPPADVKLELADGSLVMALGAEAQAAALDPATGDVNTAGANTYMAKAQHVPHPVRPLSPLALDILSRAFGEGTARAAEGAVAAIGGLFKRDHDKVAGGDSTAPAASGSAAADEPAAAPIGEAPVTADGGFPPAPITPLIRPPMPGEGEWKALTSPLLPAAGDGPDAPVPAFVQASIRPDPSKPEATVRLVAMDMRQVELRMEAGYDEPRPMTGPRGSGRLPSGPAAARVMAAFVGGKPPGFEAAAQGAQGAAATAGPASNEMGMVVDRRILIPPAPSAFTVASLRDGRAGIGRWPFGADIPAWVMSLRQSPAPLVEAGAALDMRGSAGAALDVRASSEAARGRATELVERSALCATRAGHLIYAWGSGVSAGMLARALVLSGCDIGAHLGGAPSRSGFALLKRLTEGERPWEVELLSPAMSLRPDSLSDRSPAEIFYIVKRSLEPASRAVADGAPWAVDGGKQPPPAWIPAVYSASASTLGAKVKVLAFMPDRFSWRARAGSREPSRKHIALPGELPADDLARAAAAISLAHGRRKGGAPRGMSLGGQEAFAIRKGAGALVVAEQGLAVVRSEDLPPSLAADAIELPLAADDGKLLPEGRKVGSRRARSAACVLEDGTLLVASATFDSDEATTEILLRAGCSRVVSLDRGSHQAAFVHRAGTSSPPLARYEQSALYALEIPMRGRTQIFTPAQ